MEVQTERQLGAFQVAYLLDRNEHLDFCEDITVKGAWEGPSALELFHHALAPVAALPVLGVVSGVPLKTFCRAVDCSRS